MFRQVLLILLASLGASSIPGAQAYCALRDPTSGIYELFPEADSYRSHVGTVDEKARAAVGERLPFTLHFNELGRHTLYVPLKDGVPLGFVHVRSARGRWGLVEIAWGLDLDLRVREFRFQRCRSRSKDALQAESFRRRLREQGVQGLLVLLESEGRDLPEGVDTELAMTVVRCALKTLVVTEEVWPDEVALSRAMARASVAFPDGVDLRPLEQAIDSLTAVGPGAESTSGIRHNGVRAFLVLDKSARVLGSLLATPWSVGERRATLWWTFRERELVDVDAQGGWSSPDLREAFEQSAGRPRETDCMTSADLATQEVLRMEEVLRRGG